MHAICTALGGALERNAAGWRWRDGTLEPRARDMLLAEVTPNFRCCNRGGTAYVEIPARWRDAHYWPNSRVDTQAANEIDALLRDAGKRSPIYAEGLAEALDDHRLTADGWIIDIAQWEAVMREPCGVWWDREHQDAILTVAERLNAKPA